MRERGSASEILALQDAGAITCLEVLGGAWELCHDRPALRAELVQQFRACPDAYVAKVVGDGLEELAAQVSKRPV
jgi:hypothetical protein